MLYPNKELAAFEDKNVIKSIDVEDLRAFIEKTGGSVLYADCNGKFHFNGEFRNVRFLREFCEALPAAKKPKAKEMAALEALYEEWAELAE